MAENTVHDYTMIEGIMLTPGAPADAGLAPADSVPPVADGRSHQALSTLTELTGLEFALWRDDQSDEHQIDAESVLDDVWESLGETIVGLPTTADWELLPDCPVDLCREAIETQCPQTLACASGMLYYAVPVMDDHRQAGWGYVLSRTDAVPAELILAAGALGWSQSRLNQWRESQQPQSPDAVKRLLTLAWDRHRNDSTINQLEHDFDCMAAQMQTSLEEISTLHDLARYLQASRDVADLAERCLSRLHGTVGAEGSAIWLQDTCGEGHYLVAGDMPLDEIGLAVLLGRFEDFDWSIPLVRNRPLSLISDPAVPPIRNCIILPILKGSERAGWLITCNAMPGREFGTVEASLLNTIATLLGTHIQNTELFHKHEQLLLSFVRSFVSTLDAKDPYTRGHSERVALIARRIAEQMQLPDEQIEDLYLSGLLHDIGKIGVNDAILAKPGRLTDEEFAAIKRHPVIGYDILAGIENLHHVLPGVRHHHEAYNGRGYPDQLVGEDIPLMARILAVADSFDAMASDRPYRSGMPLDELERCLHEGDGTQWDSDVIAAYFAVRDDIQRICELYAEQESQAYGIFDEHTESALDPTASSFILKSTDV